MVSFPAWAWTMSLPAPNSTSQFPPPSSGMPIRFAPPPAITVPLPSPNKSSPPRPATTAWPAIPAPTIVTGPTASIAIVGDAGTITPLPPTWSACTPPPRPSSNCCATAARPASSNPIATGPPDACTVATPANGSPYITCTPAASGAATSGLALVATGYISAVGSLEWFSPSAWPNSCAAT